jgi:hypothetical protein
MGTRWGQIQYFPAKNTAFTLFHLGFALLIVFGKTRTEMDATRAFSGLNDLRR